MTVGQSASGGPTLRGRRDECAALDRLLDGARAGRRGVVVVRGEAGVGKTALLEYAVASASASGSDLSVLRAIGVESEKELAFAALHQLCAPLLDRLDRLPAPQRDALQTTFGLSAGAVPDRFFVGLAVLGLLSEVAEERPVLCVIDDAQWLDKASAQTLAFVARRLSADSVAMLFAAREPSDEFAGLPDLVLEGLRGADARSLLASVIPGRLDERIADQLLAETRGNPLALLELPRGLTAAQLSGGFGLPGALSLHGTIEESYMKRVDALPEDTQRLLLVAAADPTGDPSLLWPGAEQLGIRGSALEPAESAGLMEVDGRVRFRHPLVRSAVYRAASPEQRREAHRALAAVTDAQVDPDRRAWHLAEAAGGPDEDVAAELERAAARAHARGGLAAAAAFLERAVALTPGPRLRADRALEAARTKVQAGAIDAARNLLATAEAGPLSELQQARADLVRAQLAFVADRGSDAAPLLVNAAKRLEPIAPELARATYMNASQAALFAGRLVAPAGSLLDVARAAAAAPPHAPSAGDLFVEGLGTGFGEGHATGVPILRRALRAFDDAMPADQELRGLPLAFMAAAYIWDDDELEAVSARFARVYRDAGALSDLALALNPRALVLLLVGDLAWATTLIDEAQVVMEATEIEILPCAALGLAALRGDEADALARINAGIRDGWRRGEGSSLSAAEWAGAVLGNGLGRYEQVLGVAQRASEDRSVPPFSNWALAEFVEAATRTGNGEAAADAAGRLAEMARATGTNWAHGIEARSRALLSTGEVAETLYREAIERLSRTRVRLELARAHLLYGEWLRREHRRLDAREQLRTALEMFTAMSVLAFAARAERELLATGERVRKRGIQTTDALTAQETQIARLARDGLSNAEIAARLFISQHTVAYHLRKVFSKLDITSRNQLGQVLPESASAGQVA